MKLFNNNKFKDVKDPFVDGQYALNRNLCEIFGVWPEQKHFWRISLQILHIFITISVLIPELVYFFEIIHDLDLVAQSIPTFCIIAASATKFFTLGLNKHVFIQIFRYVREDWAKYEKSFAREILYKYANRGHTGTIMYAICLAFASVTFVMMPMAPIIMDFIVPLNESRRSFPIFETDYGVDREEYFIPITLHAYLTTVQVVEIIVAVDTMVFVLVEHCCSLFQIVELILKRLEIENVADLENFRHNTIREAIELHKHATEFAQFLNSTFSNMYASIVIVNTLAISFTGFETMVQLEKGDYYQALRFGVIGSAMIFHLFLNSLPGQELFDHSDEEFNIIYNSNWTGLSQRNKKLIGITLMRTMKPCNLAAGGFYVMNMQNFGSVVQTSMSYLMVLSSVH